MVHIACPTCAHIFGISRYDVDTIIDCPKCKLSLRCGDNVVPEPESIRKHSNPEPMRASPSGETTVSFLDGFIGLVLALAFLFVFAMFMSGNRESPTIPTDDKKPPYQTTDQTLIKAPTRDIPTRTRTGTVDYSMVSTLRSAWRNEGWRNKSRIEQEAAMLLMIQIVQNDIDDPLDEQATLDYIQKTIGSW